MDTPIDTLLHQQSQLGQTRFCMPGHKGVLSSQDVTEAGEMDNLLHPTGALVRAQTLLAEAYGAGHAWFNTCGSTMGVYALLFSSAKPGDLILLASDCHISAIHACLLAGYRVSLVCANQSSQGLPLPLSAEQAQQALETHPDAKALFLTSPNYYGICADVDSIARLCREKGVLLLVDAAHGAHFGFSPLLPPQPCQADGWVVSAHKTLCVQNQGSFLFLGPHSRLNPFRVEQNVHRFQTTSPSWPLLAQMDKARAQLQANGPQSYAALNDRIRQFLQTLCNTGIHAVSLQTHTQDFSRLVLDISHTGVSGYAMSQILSRQGIWIEMADAAHLVLICTPQDNKQAFDRLSQALSQWPAVQARPLSPPALPVRSSEIFTPAITEYGTIKKVLLSQCQGLVSAAAVCCYPPGTSIICPGERILPSQVCYLEQAIRMGASVSGGAEENDAFFLYILDQTQI